MNVVDAWQLLSPTGGTYSFFPAHCSCSCIDYIFLDLKLISVMQDIASHPILISDHDPVSVDLNIASLLVAVKSNWCFNPNLLNDLSFTEKLKEHIVGYIKENDNGDVNDSILWEGMEAVIKAHVCFFMPARRRAREMQFGDLESTLT